MGNVKATPATPIPPNNVQSGDDIKTRIEQMCILVQQCGNMIPYNFEGCLTLEQKFIVLMQTVRDNMLNQEDLLNTWKEVYDWIDNYFNNLDVQVEINNKLDEIIASGQFNDILHQYFSSVDVEINGLKTEINGVKSDLEITKTDLNGVKMDLNNVEADVDIINNFNVINNKKIVVYGDSAATTGETIWNDLTTIYGATVTNRAIAGSSLSSVNDNSIFTQISITTDLNTFDFIFIFGGINDWQGNVFMYYGNNAGNSYFMPAVSDIIKMCSTKAPNTKLIFITPYFCWHPQLTRSNYSLNQRGYSLKIYCDTISNICSAHGIGCINLYSMSGCNEYNYSNYLQNDSAGVYVHPNTNFCHIIAKIIVNNIYSNNNNSRYESNNLLSQADFLTVACNNYNNSAYAGYRGGIIAGLPSGGNNASQRAFNFIRGAIYHLRGWTSQYFNFYLHPAEGDDIPVAKIAFGYFDIEFEASGLYYIKLSDITQNGYVSGLSLTADVFYNEMYAYDMQLSSAINTSNIEKYPSYRMTPNGIAFLGGAFNASTTITAGNAIATFPTVYSPQNQFAPGCIQQSDGSMMGCCFRINSNKIMCVGNIPSGAKIFIPNVELFMMPQIVS